MTINQMIARLELMRADAGSGNVEVVVVCDEATGLADRAMTWEEDAGFFQIDLTHGDNWTVE